MSVHSEDEGEWTVVPSRSSRPLWNDDHSVPGPPVTKKHHNRPLDDHSTHPPATSNREERADINRRKSFKAVTGHPLPRQAAGKESEGHLQSVSDARVGRDGVAVSMATTNESCSRDGDLQQKIGAPIILSRHRSGLKGSVEDRLTGHTGHTGHTGQSRTSDLRTAGLSSDIGQRTGWREEEDLFGQSRHESGPAGIGTSQSSQSWVEGGESEKEMGATSLQPQSDSRPRRGGLLVLHKEVAKETAGQESMHFDLSSEQQWPSIAGASSTGGRGLEVWPGSGRGWSRVVKDTPPMKPVVKREAMLEHMSDGEGGEGGGDFMSVVPNKKKRKKKKGTEAPPPPPPQEKKSQQPLAFDIFERMQHQPARPVLHHKSVDSKATPTAHNILDATAPAQKRGKERETPKKKKPSALRKVITKEKEVKKQLREKGLPIPPDLDVTRDTPEDSQHSEEEEADHSPLTTPTTEQTSMQTTPTTQQTTPTSVLTTPTIHQTTHTSVLTTPTTQQTTPTSVQTTPRIHNRRFREYCSHIVTEEINSVVQLLLQELVRFQDRQYQRDPIKAKSKRRYTCGLREVSKHLQLGRLKCVIVAPNLDHIQSSGGINEQVTNIVSLCRERGLPVVFALSRRRLASVLKKTFKIGCVGIFSYDGAEVYMEE